MPPWAGGIAMKYLKSSILIAGLLATTSTLSYAQNPAARGLPEYYEGLAIDGTPTQQPYRSCESKLIGSQRLWQCDPSGRNRMSGPVGLDWSASSAAATSGSASSLPGPGGVRYYNAVTANGRKTRAPSRDCVIQEYDSGPLWACPPRATAAIGTGAPAFQGAAPGGVQYYTAVTPN